MELTMMNVVVIMIIIGIFMLAIIGRICDTFERIADAKYNALSRIRESKENNDYGR